MNLPHRLRNIYESQVKALKDRLDRIDAEEDLRVSEVRYEADARSELNDALRSDLPPGVAPDALRRGLRTPDEIAAGTPKQGPGAPRPSASERVPAPAAPRADSAHPVSPLARHYRVLGLDDGADLGAVKAAYARQAARCAPERFPEGSEEQKVAAEIRRRVDGAYDALRDALDPTAGRFDKLEL